MSASAVVSSAFGIQNLTDFCGLSGGPISSSTKIQMCLTSGDVKCARATKTTKATGPRSITIPAAFGETYGGGSGSLSPPSADFRPPTNGFRVDEDLSVGGPTPTDTYWAQAGLRAPPEGGFETTRAFEAWAASAGVSAGVGLGADVEPVPINQTAPNQTVPIGNLTEYSDTDDSDDNAEQPLSLARSPWIQRPPSSIILGTRGLENIC